MKLFRPVKGEGSTRIVPVSSKDTTVPSYQVGSSHDPPKHRRSHSYTSAGVDSETAPNAAELSFDSIFEVGSGRIGEASWQQVLPPKDAAVPSPQVGSSDDSPKPLRSISAGRIETGSNVAASAAFNMSSRKPQIGLAAPRRRHDPDRRHYSVARDRRHQSYYDPFDEYRSTSPTWESRPAFAERNPYLGDDREYVYGYGDYSTVVGRSRLGHYVSRRGTYEEKPILREECKKLKKKLSELEKRYRHTLDLLPTNLPEETFSDENAVHLVNGLNDMISSIADEVVLKFGARLSTVDNQTTFNTISSLSFRPVKVALGTNALSDLLTTNHRLDTSLVRWAIQAYICHYIPRVFSHWYTDEVTTIYHDMRVKESQATSGKWRSLAYRYSTGGRSREKLDKCVSYCLNRIAMLLSISGVTSCDRWQVLVAECNQYIKTPLVALWDAALETSDMFNKEVISSDYSIVSIDSGGAFNAAEMSLQANQVGPESDTLVRYTIALGLKRTRHVDEGGNLYDGKVEERTILNPLVIRPSDAEAVKSPTQSKSTPSKLRGIPPPPESKPATADPSAATSPTPPSPQIQLSNDILPSPQRLRSHSRADQDHRISTIAVAAWLQRGAPSTKFGTRLSSQSIVDSSLNRKSDILDQSSPTKKRAGVARRNLDGVTSTGPWKPPTVRDPASSFKRQTIPRPGAKLPPSGQVAPVRPSRKVETKRTLRLVEVDKPLPPLEIPEIPDEHVAPTAVMSNIAGTSAVSSAHKQRNSETDSNVGKSAKTPSNTECNPNSLPAGPSGQSLPMPVERDNAAEPTPAPVDAAEAARVQANIMNILMAEIRGW